MSGLSAALATQILDHLRGGPMWHQPTGLYFQLHTADPGPGGMTAVAAGDGTRRAAAYADPAIAPLGSMIQIGTTPTWTNHGVTTEVLTHIAVFDDPVAGMFLFSFPLAPAHVWEPGTDFPLTAYSYSLSPLAI